MDTDNEDNEVIRSFNPREYQEELLRIASKKNIIIYLPTGSGKTYIATLLIRQLSWQLDRSKLQNELKTTYFIVNTVCLAEQQYDQLRSHLNLKIVKITGELNADSWKQEEWSNLIKDYQVMVITAQLYYNNLIHGYMQITDANLIIIDECHHAVNQHPMRQIMVNYYDRANVGARPKILGLTAALLNQNINKPDLYAAIQNVCDSLERSLSARIYTSTVPDEVKQFSTDPTEEIIYFGKYVNCAELACRLDQFVENCLAPLRTVKMVVQETSPDEGYTLYMERNKELYKKFKRIFASILETTGLLNELGPAAAFYCVYINAITVAKMRPKNETGMCYPAQLLVDSLLNVISQELFRTMHIEGDEMNPTNLLNNSSEKLIILVNKLKTVDRNTSCLVFVQKRATAQSLYWYFKELCRYPGYENIRCDFLVGSLQSGYKIATVEESIEKLDRKTTILKFNKGETNVLFCTDLLEEGIDIQMCNLVIKFDDCLTYRSYVQSKGRARSRGDSQYIILLQKGIANAKNPFSPLCPGNYKKVGDCLDAIMETKTIDNMENDLSINNNKDPELIYTTNLGAQLVPATAIALVNRYCQSNFSDEYFTHFPLYWISLIGKAIYRCQLQLPRACPIKELFEGIGSKYISRHNAAFEAVKKLHMCEELDDNLTPKKRLKPVIEKEEQWFPKLINEDCISGKPGTKKCTRVTDMRIPKFLNRCYPLPNEVSFLYVFELIPIDGPPSEDLERKRSYYNIFNRPFSYGMITNKPIPEVSPFLLHLPHGKYQVKINENRCNVILTRKQISSLHSFNSIFYTDILKVAAPFLISQKEEVAHHYLIAPILTGNKDRALNPAGVLPVKNRANLLKELDKCSEFVDVKVVKKSDGNPIFCVNANPNYAADMIDWKFVKEVVTPVSCVRNLIDDDNWSDKIVWKSTDEKKQPFVVIRKCDELNSYSQFMKKNESYANFLKETCNIELKYPDLPLVKIRGLGKKLDFLRPDLRSEKTIKKSDEYGEYWPPELLNTFIIPSHYHLKAYSVPSILHRIQYLMLAEELLCDITKNTNIIPPVIEYRDLPPVGVEIRGQEIFEDHVEKRSNESDKFLSVPDKCLLRFKDIERYVSIASSSCHVQIPKCSSAKVTLKEAPKLDIMHITSLSAGFCMSPTQFDILSAITTKSAYDVMDLERLETLGDCFLKFAASLTIVYTCPDKNEADWTAIKSKLVGNAYLYYCARHLGIPSYIKACPFVPKVNWCPPGFFVPECVKDAIGDCEFSAKDIITDCAIPLEEQISGELSIATKVKILENSSNLQKTDNNTELLKSLQFYLGKQTLSDKTVADTVEALIGCYVSSGGIHGGFEFLKYLGIFSDYCISYKDLKDDNFLEANISISEITKCLPQYKDIEERLGYTFHNKSYLLQALVHPSYSTFQNIDCYQKLEFIGDAVLDLLVTLYIYQYNKTLTPGELTELRSSLVNNVTLASFIVRLKIHNDMLYNSQKLFKAMSIFADYQEQNNHEIGTEIIILRNEVSTPETELPLKMQEEFEKNIHYDIDIPKPLGDIFEAIIGAIFLDSNRNLDTVWKILYNIMHEQLIKFSQCIPQNPIKVLHDLTLEITEKFVSDEKTKLTYAIAYVHDKITKEVIKKYYGVGDNKKTAKKAVAKLILKDHLHLLNQKDRLIICN